MRYRRRRCRIGNVVSYARCLLLIGVWPTTVPLCAEERVLESRLRHLRNVDGPREWSSFSDRAEATELRLTFEVTDAFVPQTLRLRHRDLKQRWQMHLDDRPLADLPTDENDMTTFWSLPKERMTSGKHELRIGCSAKVIDDVLIGEAALLDRARDAVLADAAVDVTVVDSVKRPIPCRLTIIDEHGSMMTTAVAADARLAVRPGVIYSGDGRARFTLPNGKYTIYAGRGFEYSLASESLSLTAGDAVSPRLTLIREVPTDGWVACDPHVHTLTFSGHGDATVEERMLTLAGEGIELAITTEHNRQVEVGLFAEKAGVASYFTSAVGNEVTTRVGHFNVFPLSAQSPVIDHQVADWSSVGASIQTAGGKPVVILNHARDIHSGFRPFDPARHLSLAGESADGWQLPANAMEVFNSGATQSDPWQLFHDWLGLLNRGLNVAPIGASDSHDVSRYLVGQGRTYIQVDDGQPGRIDVAGACQSLREGRVMAGLGLLCRVTINDRHGPGTVAPQAEEYVVDVEVLGPSWVKVDEVRLYINGMPTSESTVEQPANELPLGIRRRLRWTLKHLRQDAHLVAVARGPGVVGLYWPIGKPYQPTSPDGTTYVAGCSGAVRIDADDDGKFSSPHDYARALVDSTDEPAALLRQLAAYDEATAVQAASLLRQRGGGRFERLMEAADIAEPHVKRGVSAYFQSWRTAVARE